MSILSRFISPKNLAYMGLIPFLTCLLLICFKIHSIPLLGEPKHVLNLYGLIIASFISGAHWGQHLSQQRKWGNILPILSNLNVMLLFFLTLTLPNHFKFMALILSFLLSIFIDRKLFQSRLITPVYFKTRTIITVLVIIMIVVSGLLP